MNNLYDDPLYFHIILFYSISLYTVTHIFSAKHEKSHFSLLAKYLDWLLVNFVGNAALFFLMSSPWYYPSLKMPILNMVSPLSVMLFFYLVVRRPLFPWVPEKYQDFLLFLFIRFLQVIMIATVLPVLWFLLGYLLSGA